jgi:mono/diheme cytochrome c family protein
MDNQISTEGDQTMTKGHFWLTVIVLAELAVAPISRAQNQAEGKKLYVTYCVSCHGEQGKGDGTAAAALPVKPADHTNGAVMNQLSDKFLIDVISKGGAGVGKSTFMPSWGGALNDKQIRDIVAYIRTIAAPPYKP